MLQIHQDTVRNLFKVSLVEEPQPAAPPPPRAAGVTAFQPAVPSAYVAGGGGSCGGGAAGGQPGAPVGAAGGRARGPASAAGRARLPGASPAGPGGRPERAVPLREREKVQALPRGSGVEPRYRAGGGRPVAGEAFRQGTSGATVDP